MMTESLIIRLFYIIVNNKTIIIIRFVMIAEIAVLALISMMKLIFIWEKRSNLVEIALVIVVIAIPGSSATLLILTLQTEITPSSDVRYYWYLKYHNHPYLVITTYSDFLLRTLISILFSEFWTCSRMLCSSIASLARVIRIG